MVYNVANMLNFLGISRAQLTVLGIVSKNDYTTNLARLGVTTNFKIHKSLKDAEQGIVNPIFFSFISLLHPRI